MTHHHPLRTPSTSKLSPSHFHHSMSSSSLSSPSIPSLPFIHSSSSPILRRNTRIHFTPATPSSSLPVTPHHHPHSSNNLLERVLSSPSRNHSFQPTLLHPSNRSLYRKLVQTGIPLTPNKLSKAINQLISEKKSKSSLHPSEPLPVSLKRPIDHLDQTARKKIRIQSATDGSASLALSSQPNHTSKSWITPTTIRTASYPPSISSKSCTIQPRAHSTPVYHQSSLVSADIQDYGRVAIKREALIDKLGFEAAQRAIHKARGSRQAPPIHSPKRAQPPPSPQNASSRTSRIKRWLDLADLEEEDDGKSIVHAGLRLKTQAGGLLDTLTRLTESQSQKTKHKNLVEACASDAQTLFWSPPKSTTSHAIINPLVGKRSTDHPELNLPSVPYLLGPGSHHSSRASTWLDRPSTPPNQQSFFRCDLEDRPDDLGSFSNLSCSQLAPPSSMSTMLKPGCNLNHSFLSLAPSPTIVLSGSEALGAVIQNDENRPHVAKSQPDTRHHMGRLTPAGYRSRQSSHNLRPSKNDFSPCSPVRQEVAKLIDHQSRPKSPSDYNLVLENMGFDSYSSDQGTDQPWLTELDPNRETLDSSPQSHRPHPSNYTHLTAFTSSPDFFDDKNFFEDFLVFSSV